MGTIVRSAKALLLLTSLGAVIAVPTASRAQSTDYPNQRVSIVVGFAVGGFADTVGRTSLANLRRAEHGRRRRNPCGTAGRNFTAGRLHPPRHHDIARHQRV